MAGIYVHFPFCCSKCRYCDFHSVPLRRDLAAKYCQALLKEVALLSTESPGSHRLHPAGPPDPDSSAPGSAPGRCTSPPGSAPGHDNGPAHRLHDWEEIETIYLGGGTPSLMEPEFTGKLLTDLRRSFHVSHNAEITLEANPGTVDRRRLEGFIAAGINRISLGAQTLCDAELETLGRLHRRKEVLEAVMALHDLQFENFNLDLIYGIPGQTLESWLRTLREAVELNPKHLSCYLLQLEEDVPMASAIKGGKLTPLEEETEAQMYYAMIDKLAASGFDQYEISNFARQTDTLNSSCQVSTPDSALTGTPNFECLHNINYWQSGEYLGLGSGAVSFKDGCRSRNLPDITRYISHIFSGDLPLSEILETMSLHEQAAESLMLGLRMIRGVESLEFRKRFGVDPMESFASPLARALESGLVTKTPSNLRLTRRGYFLSNSVFVHLV